MDVRTFGDNLRAVRKRKGLTQEDLMQRLGLKRNGPISIWERSGRLPEPQTIVKIAAALDCPPSELLEGVQTDYDRLRMNLPLGPTARSAPHRARGLPVRGQRAASGRRAKSG